MATENKQAQLVTAIADGVSSKIKGDLDGITKMMAQLNTGVAALEARLALVEAAASGSGAKRPTKATGKAAAGGAKKAGAKANDDPLAKVINSMLYFRHMWVTDKEFREAWAEALGDVETMFDGEQSITKKAAGSTERLSAEAQYLWKNVLADEQKKEIRDAFTKWQAARKAGAEEPQLEEDGKGAD